MIETNNPEIDVNQLMERVRREASKVSPSGNGLSRPAVATNGIKLPVPLETPPPSLTLSESAPYSDRIAAYLGRAYQKNQVSSWIPALLRGLFRRQGGFNRGILETLGALDEENKNLHRRVEELAGAAQSQNAWLQILAGKRQSEARWRQSTHRRLQDESARIGALQSDNESHHAAAETLEQVRLRQEELRGELQTTREKLQGQDERAGQQLNSLQAAAELALQQIRDLISQGESAGEHLRHLQGIVDRTTQPLQDLQAQSERAGEHLRHLQGMVDRTTQPLQDLQAQSERAAEHLRHLQDVVDRTTPPLQDLQAQSERAGEHLRRLQDVVDRATQHLEDLQAQGDRSAEHLRNLQGEVERRQQNLHLLQEMLVRVEDRQINDSIYTKGELSYFGILVRRCLEALPLKNGAPADGPVSSQIDAEERHALDSLYLTFENQFRGSRSAIKERVRFYLPAVREVAAGTPARPILDLGCGRGEWLELLGEEGLETHGVDLNRMMVAECAERGLNVTGADALEYLRSLADASQGAVTGFHIIEHLPLETLVALIAETRRVLHPGGLAIFESPNCKNLMVGASNFNIDPTHRNPVYPETARFMLSAHGFERLEIAYLSPVDTSAVADVETVHPIMRELLYGPQDFAVLGRKPGAS